MPHHESKVYQAPSGQWAWRIYCDNEEICAGAGYSSSEEAHDDCQEHLQNFDIEIEPTKAPRNRFAILLDELTDANARTCLRTICDGHHRTSDIEKQVGIYIAPYLHHLTDLGLIHDDLVGGWTPTWTGDGVNNWHRHTLLAYTHHGEPRENENGQDIIEGCEDFRKFLCCPGYCWCGKHQAAHPSEAIKAAEKLLAGPESRSQE